MVRKRSLSRWVALGCLMALAHSSAGEVLPDAPVGRVELVVGTTELVVGADPRMSRDASATDPLALWLVLNEPNAPTAGAGLSGGSRLGLRVGPHEVPTWRLPNDGLAYRVGPLSIGRAMSAEGVTLTLSVPAELAGRGLRAIWVPAAKTLEPAVDAPLIAAAELATDPREAAFLRGWVDAISARPDVAAQRFEAVMTADDALASRAERGLQRLELHRATRAPGRDGADLFRAAVYADQLDMVGDALRLYALAADRGGSAVDPGDALMRAAMLRRRSAGTSLRELASLLEAAGRLAQHDARTEAVDSTDHAADASSLHAAGTTSWRVLVVVVADAASERAAEIAAAKEQWRTLARTIAGISRGRLMLEVETHPLDSARGQKPQLMRFTRSLVGPRDEVVRRFGEFDLVVCYRAEGSGSAGGADFGPAGAALIDLPHGAQDLVALRALSQVIDWACIVSEASAALPSTASYLEGAPDPLLALLQRLEVHLAPGRLGGLRINPARDEPLVISRWWVAGVHAIDVEPPSTGRPSKHTLFFVPEPRAELRPEALRTDGDGFLSLKALLDREVPAGWGVVQLVSHVWSPVAQQIDLTLGYNDGAAVWVNYVPVQRGVYYGRGRWRDGRVPRMVTRPIQLVEGWNRVDVTVEAWPAPFEKEFGIAAQLQPNAPEATRSGNETSDTAQVLRVATSPSDWAGAKIERPAGPRFGDYYRWRNVRDDPLRWLPEVTSEDLRAHMGLSPNEFVTLRADPELRWFAVQHSQMDLGTRFGGVLLRALPVRDASDSVPPEIDNVLLRGEERLALVPYQRDGLMRHLIFVSPEEMSTVLTILRESSSDQGRGATESSVADRVLGYVAAGSGRNRRIWYVAEARIGGALPAREAALFTPAARRTVSALGN